MAQKKQNRLASPELDDVALALQEAAAGKLVAAALDGSKPRRVNFRKPQCGWVVTGDGPGQVRYAKFGTTPDEVDESIERVERLADIPDFDSRFAIKLVERCRLERRQAQTVVMVVKLPVGKKGPGTWMLYRHPVLDKATASCLTRRTLQIAEIEEATEAELEAIYGGVC